MLVPQLHNVAEQRISDRSSRPLIISRVSGPRLRLFEATWSFFAVRRRGRLRHFDVSPAFAPPFFLMIFVLRVSSCSHLLQWLIDTVIWRISGRFYSLIAKDTVSISVNVTSYWLLCGCAAATAADSWRYTARTPDYRSIRVRWSSDEPMSDYSYPDTSSSGPRLVSYERHDSVAAEYGSR